MGYFVYIRPVARQSGIQQRCLLSLYILTGLLTLGIYYPHHNQVISVKVEDFSAQLLDCSKLSGNYNTEDSFLWNSSCFNGTRTANSSSLYTSSLINQETDLRERKRKQADHGCPPPSPPQDSASEEEQLDGNVSVPFFVCTPKIGNQISQSTHLIELSITAPSAGQLEGDTQTYTAPTSGLTFVASCRFKVLASNQDIRFKLKWLRAVDLNGTGSRNRNESIKNYPIESHSGNNFPLVPQLSNEKLDQYRLTTVRREGGLDLVIYNVSEADSGDYFCQATTKRFNGSLIETRTADGDELLDEKKIRVRVEPSRVESKPAEIFNSRAISEVNQEPSIGTLPSDRFSRDNLMKLLPSLIVIPDFSEPEWGSLVQLSCITNDLDPEPEPSSIEWIFNTKDEYLKTYDSSGSSQLPPGSSALGNQLIIWNVTDQHIGIYTCRVNLSDFNLIASATSEISPRPNSESAPLVLTSPELVRLSAGGSASLQCEATGFPRPKLDWYRVDDSSARSEKFPKQDANSSSQASLSSEDDIYTIETISHREISAYCEQNRCLLTKTIGGRTSASSEIQVTAISLVHLTQVRAEHQGQYVCKATNKHGSNQASSLVDVEFKEAPMVELDKEHQTIFVPDSSGERVSGFNAVFKCTVVAGRPKPRLRWLRAGALASNASPPSQFKQYQLRLSNSSLGENLDLFDLSKVSSATSHVSTWLTSDGKTLVLEMSTISASDEGEYVCLAENEVGRYSAVAQLSVRKPANVRIVQVSPKIARPNESFHLECRIFGHPAPQDIEWSRSDRGAFFALISNQPRPLERAVLKFDRVTRDDAGEYTCAARDPFNSSLIIRDAIMVLVEEQQQQRNPALGADVFYDSVLAKQLPQLLVRPTKVSALVGANITLDCLAMSGLQPTVVEWLAPSEPASIRSYYRSDASLLPNHASLLDASTSAAPNGLVLQFGSKLRIFNATKAHEGVYQCKGRNRVGVENAPALVKIVEPDSPGQQPRPLAASRSNQTADNSSPTSTSQTKVALTGSNIELRCQVNGLPAGGRPATSWSREGKELPRGSLQIEHNLWIQNLSQSDEGLYLCSARSNEPNQIIQAKINLLIRSAHQLSYSSNFATSSNRYAQAKLSAKVVASKSPIRQADSVTLECIIRQEELNSSLVTLSSEELHDMERQVYWTNLHSGQSIFQDNVYIQNNLLIIYDLKADNSATYRCNFNDLTQHVDYELQVLDQEGNPMFAAPSAQDQSNHSSRVQLNDPMQGQQAATLNHTFNQHVELKKVSPNSRLVLECARPASNPSTLPYFWTRGSAGISQVRVGSNSMALVLDSIQVQHADLYQCHQQVFKANIQDTSMSSYETVASYIVLVHTSSARFVQRPVSFITLPAAASMSLADRRLTQIELKFVPEREHGLILFCGASGSKSLLSDHQSEPDDGPASNSSSKPSHNSRAIADSTSADFISVGLNRGHLEFRFELGDGTSLVRSSHRLTMNQWHRVIIERRWRNSTLWIDGHEPQARQSVGKFLDLNLDDTVLFVGGHQAFLSAHNHLVAGEDDKSSPSSLPLNSTRVARFSGYAHGFVGCISYLKVNGHELDLISRARSVAVGVFECDKQECRKQPGELGEQCAPNGFCQVDRAAAATIASWTAQSSSGNETMTRAPNGLSAGLQSDLLQASRRAASSPAADLRCICAPEFAGPTCNELASRRPTAPLENDELPATPLEGVHAPWSEGSKIAAAAAGPGRPPLTWNQAQALDQAQAGPLGPCEQRPLDATCSTNGTLECQSLTSSAYKCHCRLGFTGERCQSSATFASLTAAHFSQQSFLQLAFRPAPLLGALAPSVEQFAMHGASKARTGPEQSAPTLRLANESGSNSGGGDQMTGADIGLTPKAQAELGHLQSLWAKWASADDYAQSSSFTERINVSFSVQTRANFGLLFYLGPAQMSPPNGADRAQEAPIGPLVTRRATATSKRSAQQAESSAAAAARSSGGASSPTDSALTATDPAPAAVGRSAQLATQSSKSVVANLLARLAALSVQRPARGGSSPQKGVADFLAIALIDGHVELSYELGSGPAIIRSTRRINDGLEHQIEATRVGKLGQLRLDNSAEAHYEGHSPGKLSMLNTGADIYLGGLPALLRSVGSSSSASLMSTFAGCISQLQINSLGPLNLIRTNQLTQIKSARNVGPCNAASSPRQLWPNTGAQLDESSSLQQASSSALANSSSLPQRLEGGAGGDTYTGIGPVASAQSSSQPPTKRPAYSFSTADTDSDDADELGKSR